ncbi:MAG: regulatory protein RecX [Simkaniaceae bacterium]|nr:regulatory protein RecX [Candidatus Sacchlamyda saccharinae]
MQENDKLPPIRVKAYALLAKKAYFTKQLSQKLKEKGYPALEISKLIKELVERGWVNDTELGARYIEQQKAKGYGARIIALKLKEKAGPLDLPIEESPEFARALIERKYAKDLPEKKDKVIRALLRRGYTYELIKRLLEDISCKNA